jgi:hypothetical protein
MRNLFSYLMFQGCLLAFMRRMSSLDSHSLIRLLRLQVFGVSNSSIFSGRKDMFEDLSN